MSEKLSVQKKIVISLKKRFTNLRTKIETGSRVLATLKADRKSTRDRLLQTINDNVREDEKKLGKIAKTPDRLAVEIYQKEAELAKFRMSLKEVAKRFKKEDKKLRKMEQKRRKAQAKKSKK